MQEYIIQPWDELNAAGSAVLNLEQYVPPEVEAMAWEVVGLYDMKVSGMSLITAKPDKGGAIWRIDTNKGPRSLKVLHRTPYRSLFSVGAQEYVVRQGGRVPSLIPARDGQLYVEAGGKLWIVTDWITLQPASKIDLEGAMQLCKGLGEFHRHTKGYVPPELAANSSRLYKWPKYYEKIITKIGWFRDIANAYSEMPASKQLLSVVDMFDKQAREALVRLEASSYYKMIAMGEPYWGLVHQDYGWSNGQMGPGGIWVIDLDGVAYDLPIRDLRKLITSTMDDMGVWDVTWMRGMIEAYHEGNPIDAETFEVLLNDMSLPNEFYKHVKEVVFEPTLTLNSELEVLLQRLMATEDSKRAALAELAADKSKYAQGDYSKAPENYAVTRIPSEHVFKGTPLGASRGETYDRDITPEVRVPEFAVSISPEIAPVQRAQRKVIQFNLKPKRKKQTSKRSGSKKKLVKNVAATKVVSKKVDSQKITSKKITSKKVISKNAAKSKVVEKQTIKKTTKTNTKKIVTRKKQSISTPKTSPWIPKELSALKKVSSVKTTNRTKTTNPTKKTTNKKLA
ncbi:CotS family spore coat protein [Paenibacillus sediminis]|uniref:CotS family spore coat protein n=1 Tax=Paenibacillus sediminis TaxID=664909 RepID=A0ABS4H5S2_9BACL|nr:CotS family spore coat protein [Paenibacillus sediminis]MBP1937875.1 CotS family spore coat protein [Paenibacillus sediminis]